MEIILKSLPHFPKECVYKPNLFYLKIPRQDLYQNLCDRSELKHYGPKESRWLSKTSSYHTYCQLLKSEENLAVEAVVFGTIQCTHLYDKPGCPLTSQAVFFFRGSFCCIFHFLFTTVLVCTTNIFAQAYSAWWCIYAASSLNWTWHWLISPAIVSNSSKNKSFSSYLFQITCSSFKGPFDSPNGGHLSPEKVTYGPKRGNFDEPGSHRGRKISMHFRFQIPISFDHWQVFFCIPTCWLLIAATRQFPPSGHHFTIEKQQH